MFSFLRSSMNMCYVYAVTFYRSWTLYWFLFGPYECVFGLLLLDGLLLVLCACFWFGKYNIYCCDHDGEKVLTFDIDSRVSFTTVVHAFRVGGTHSVYKIIVRNKNSIRNSQSKWIVLVKRGLLYRTSKFSCSVLVRARAGLGDILACNESIGSPLP